MRNPFKRSKTSPLVRYSPVVRTAGQRERSHMRHWWQWAALALVLLVVVGGVTGFVVYQRLEDRITDTALETSPAEKEGEPFNALLVGSDSRTGLTEKQQLELGANAIPGQRSDTIILAHVDPSNDNVTMVQFPRDLYVPIDGGGKDKINMAFEGGANRLIRTIKKITGLEISHYAQVNIAGFRQIVNAIGGVDICITEPIPFDPNTGIEIKPEEVGMVHFDGDRALRFVRSRHSFVTGDLERIQNQQKFLAAAIDKVVSASTFFNPGRLIGIVKAVGDNVKVDKNTPISKLRKIASQLRNIDPDTYEAYTVPNLGTKQITLSSGAPYDIVVPDKDAMKVMFGAIADNESPAEADGVPDIDPSSIRVGVYNGTGIPGRATSVAARLEEATATQSGPVEIAEVADARHLDHKKASIIYDRARPATEDMAELVAAAVPGTSIAPGRTRPRVDVALIVGKAKVPTQRIVQIQPIPLPQPAAPPEVCRK